jgi:hypothetical protein
MGKIIAQRAAIKPRIPSITIEELVDALVLYLPTIADYRHEALRIDCDRFYRNTTIDLYGQFDPKLARRVWLRVTIDDIATTKLRSELWPDRFVIRLDSKDLNLAESYIIDPRADRSIEFLKVLRWEQGRPIVVRPAQQIRCALVKGDNSFDFPVVGVAHFQRELQRIARARRNRSGDHLVAALLVPERNNRRDGEAVAVQIERQTVGYMGRDIAPAFLKVLGEGGFDCAAAASLVAERVRGAEPADFGVRLDAVLPFVLEDRPADAST